MNKFTFLLFVFVLGAIEVNSQCLVSAHCFSGNANDISGNGNNGTVKGAILTSDRFGVVNSAYMFDGVDDYIEIPAKVYSLNSYTYSLWVNPSSIPSSSTATVNRYTSIFNIGNYGAAQQILISNNPSLGHVGLGGGGYNMDGNVVRTNSGSVPTTNKWYHLTLTRSNTKIKFYINGFVVDSVVYKASNAKYKTPIRATIGARHGDSQFFHGKIDDIKIFNCELSAIRVFGLFESGVCEVTSTSSIERIENKMIVSPNPTNGNVIVRAEHSLKKGILTVYDVTGSLVYKRIFDNLDEIEVPMPDASGMYIIEISGVNSKSTRFKVMKN